MSRYEASARDILHAFKFGSRPELAGPLARRMCETWIAEPALSERKGILLPVPQRFWKERRRGYNPASLLARAVGHQLGMPVRRRGLRKVRWTPDQALIASADERARNLRGAFRPGPSAAGLAGRRAILIDDVVTTGATAAECARALLNAGASEVVVLAFARTPRIKRR